MRRVLLAALFVCGCGGGTGDIASARMALATSGLSPSEVRAVEVLVLAGDGADCPHLLSLPSPLDDAKLDVVAHGLFTVDGAAKHLTIPAGRHLAFWADAYDGSGPGRRRVGRGCAEGALERGASEGVMITLVAASD